MSTLALLPQTPIGFPHPDDALSDPEGLVAVGGALTVPWLLEAYSRGIFPWFDNDGFADDGANAHILWWSPRERAVTVPGTMRVSRSLKKRIRSGQFEIRMDHDFAAVIAGCSGPRMGSSGTWITASMRSAYTELHRQGYAHSVEVYDAAGTSNTLVGGLYGVSIGKLFFGESMFSQQSDASKVAFYWLHEQLRAWQFDLIDCQIQNPHLQSLGVNTISRTEFLSYVGNINENETRKGKWHLDVGEQRKAG